MKAKDIFMYLLAVIIVAGFFIVLYVVFRTEMPATNKDIGLLVIGALVSKFSDVFGYYFGSSKSSADKNEIFNKKINGNEQN